MLRKLGSASDSSLRVIPCLMTKTSKCITVEPDTSVPSLAILAADSFYKNAQQFISQGPSNTDGFCNYAVRNAGELIASATTLALAIELYIKGTMLRLNVPAPKTHNLPELFSALPMEIREQVIVMYEQLTSQIVIEKASSVTLGAIRSGASLQKFEPAALTNDLMSVLNGSSDAFVTWRYFFEFADPERGRELTYEFEKLSAIAKSLRAQSEVKVDGISQKI
jgi:hypothetical protein